MTSAAQSKSTIFQAQAKVAELLNSCPDLSATPFWPEDALDIEYQVRDALQKQGIACMVMTPRLDYQGRCGESTAWDMNSLELLAVENPQVNRAREDAMTALDVAYKAVEWLAGPDSPTRGMFTPVTIRQGEEQKRVVVTAELKALLHDEEERERLPTRQQAVFRDGTAVKVADAVFQDSFLMQNLCTAIGQRLEDLVETDVFAESLQYSLASPFRSWTGLKKVYIAPSVQSIQAGEFAGASSVEDVLFGGRTMTQVQAMDGYPWGLDEGVIRAEI